MGSIRTRTTEDGSKRHTGLYRDAEGKQRSAGTFTNIKDARNAVKTAEGLEASGRNAKAATQPPRELHAETKRGQLTVAGYFPRWLAGHRLEATSRQSYECMGKHVIKGIGNMPMRDVEPADVRAWFRRLEATGLSNSTIGHVKTTASEMFKTAITDKIVTSNPVDGLKIAGRRAGEMRILSVQEYRALLAAVLPHYTLMVRTAVETGLRWGELVALRPSDIQGNVIKVRRTIMELTQPQRFVERGYGKTAKAQRDISITPDLASAITAIAEGDEFLFRAHRGGQVSRTNFRRVFKAACTTAGITGVRVHDLRHTHASWLANGGADLVTVRDRLGHSDIKITSRYLHVVAGTRDVALDALSATLAA
jgi:integrase